MVLFKLFEFCVCRTRKSVLRFMQSPTPLRGSINFHFTDRKIYLNSFFGSLFLAHSKIDIFLLQKGREVTKLLKPIEAIFKHFCMRKQCFQNT